jgi:hypothetical protein
MVGGWDLDGMDDGSVWRFYKLEVLSGIEGGGGETQVKCYFFLIAWMCIFLGLELIVWTIGKDCPTVGLQPSSP